MLVLITYDVNTENLDGKRRLRKVAKACQNYGQRVQNSVFECVLDGATFVLLQNSLLKMMDQEKDSIRFYFLGNHYHDKVKHFGAKPGYDVEDVLML